MSEATPEETPAQETPSTEGNAEEPPADGPQDWEAEATRLREELSKARKWEKQSRENAARLRELERERLPEAERAAVEAEERGRQAAAQQYGQRLARSEITAAAATAGADLGGVFDYLDLNRFVGDDGEPDGQAIAAFVEALPRRDATPPSFDGGTRGTPPAGADMNQFIRKAAGRA